MSELTREQIEDWRAFAKEQMSALPYREMHERRMKEINALCDMALRSLEAAGAEPTLAMCKEGARVLSGAAADTGADWGTAKLVYNAMRRAAPPVSSRSPRTSRHCAGIRGSNCLRSCRRRA